MNFLPQANRWLYLGLSVCSLCLAIILTPATASVPFPVISAAKNATLTVNTTTTNPIEQGRELYQLGRFTEAAQVWRTAVDYYRNQGDRQSEALSLNYLSLAQQELNQWDNAQQSIERSLKLLQTNQPTADAILWAQVLNTQAKLQLYLGNAQAALSNWQQAQKYYEQAGDTIGSLGTQINQAQALQNLGFHRRAQQQLLTLTSKLIAMPDSEVKVSSLRSLGLALQIVGDSQSQEVLEKSLAIAQKINAKPQLSSILLSLGKNASVFRDPEVAFNYFEDAEQAATNPSDRLQAGLARFQLLLDYKKPEHAASLAPQILQQLQALPPSHNSLYSAINFVATLNRQSNSGKILPIQEQAQLMATTVKSAEQLKDAAATAYAFQQWGQLYRRTQQWSQAQELANKSLNVARQISADDIIAQSAWQVGQLYRQQGDRPAAIAAYTEAVKALKAMRSDLVAINSDVQFSFRESVEPVYRELVGLLLDNQPSQEELAQARELIESLQLAELDNFFREACLDRAAQIDQVDPTATVIYPIILPDRLAVIISQAGRPLRYYVTKTSQAEIEQTLDNLLVALNPVSDAKDRDRFSQKIYNWLIRPEETDQVFKDSKTLVFVLDGKLRNIPMAALYDGKQYLIEKYAVALSPGLQLMTAQSLQKNQISALIGGISESRSGFSALPAVELEVKQISQKLPSLTLLNQKFTSQALSDLIKSNKANIVHLATHGQFSSRLEDTYLLTWDGQVNIKELSELLKNRGNNSSKAIDLLVLSACDTATGDERAALGLAGLAVKSGARSTIATLWPVKDQAAQTLMTRFYDKLKASNITKAEALRQAQINLMHQTDFQDPFFWSAFVLVGNWQ